MPQFSYCSSIWNSCLKEDSDRLERLHERALRYVFNDFSNGYQTIGDLVSKETVCCVGGKVKHLNRLSTTRSIR